MEYEFKIGRCPFCNQGTGEFVKGSITNEIVLHCSECDTIWKKPDDFFNDAPFIGYEFKGKVVSPALEELFELGWDKYLDKS